MATPAGKSNPTPLSAAPAPVSGATTSENRQTVLIIDDEKDVH